MEQTKEQILTNLYALRAGLSVISQETDKYKSLLKNKQYLEEEVIKILCSVFRYNPIDDAAALCLIVKKFWWIRAKSEFCVFGRCSSLNDESYKYLQSLCSKSQIDLMTDRLIGADKAIYEKYLEIIKKWMVSEESINHFKTKLSENEAELSRLNSGLKKIFNKEKILNFKSHINELKNIITQLEPVNFDYKENNIRIPEQYAALKLCNELYTALQKEYNKVLDVRDWQHLDLVIFYLETRRADSVKEALQLMDRELQTQRIENVIIAATKQICNTLAVGFTMLQETMVTCCNNISAQIAQASAVQSAQLTQLTSAVNMGNALKAKANVTSEQLMNDVKQIRNLVCN